MIRICSWLLALWLCLPAPLHAAWDDEKILRLSPRDLPPAAGQPIRQLRIATLRNGQFVPVPFQIDEYNTAGLVWFPATGVPLNGRENIFDGEDRLLLLAGDLAGESVATGVSLPPGYLGELALTFAGEIRYLQLIAGEFPRSAQLYVRHDLAKGTTETPFYSLEVDPKNELNWRHLNVRGWRGPRDESLVDTLKLRISGGVFTGLTRLTLDNDNLKPRVVGARSGAIRSITQLETSVVVAGVTVMKMQVQLVRYPRHFEAYTHARIPKLYRMALADPEVRVTVDGNTNQMGATVRTARSNGIQAIVDGNVDAGEKQLVARGLNAADDWILYDHRNGFSMLTFLDIPAELRQVPLQLVYEDAPTTRDKPERVPGQHPNLGYGIRGFPPGEDFRFGVTLVFGRELGAVDARQYVTRWREAPTLRFTPASP